MTRKGIIVMVKTQPERQVGTVGLAMREAVVRLENRLMRTCKTACSCGEHGNCS